jgi:hypothetical protein
MFSAWKRTTTKGPCLLKPITCYFNDLSVSNGLTFLFQKSTHTWAYARGAKITLPLIVLFFHEWLLEELQHGVMLMQIKSQVRGLFPLVLFC